MQESRIFSFHFSPGEIVAALRAKYADHVAIQGMPLDATLSADKTGATLSWTRGMDQRITSPVEAPTEPEAA